MTSQSASASASAASTNYPSCPWKQLANYILESAPRPNSCCRSCHQAIGMGELRIGVVYQHDQGFICINWHHLDCCDACNLQVEDLEGYRELTIAERKQVHLWAQVNCIDDEMAVMASPTSASA